ncbi:hypothetical protein ABBQ38_010618 [Trebouxia sp. C0009 RCD-2024]
MTPRIAGDTLGLLGWQGIRCCKHCLLFDSIACTGFFLCSFLLTCVGCQTDVFCFTAFGLWFSSTHDHIPFPILGRMVLRLGLPEGFPLMCVCFLAFFFFFFFWLQGKCLLIC